MKTTRHYLAAVPFDEGIAAEPLEVGGRIVIAARRPPLGPLNRAPFIAQILGVHKLFNYERYFEGKFGGGHSVVAHMVLSDDYPVLLEIRAYLRGFYCLYREIGGNAKLTPIDELTMRGLLAAKLGHPLEDDEPTGVSDKLLSAATKGPPAWSQYVEEYKKILASKPLTSAPLPVVIPKPKKRKTAQPKEGLFKPRLRVAEIGRKRIVDFDDD